MVDRQRTGQSSPWQRTLIEPPGPVGGVRNNTDCPQASPFGAVAGTIPGPVVSPPLRPSPRHSSEVNY